MNNWLLTMGYIENVEANIRQATERRSRNVLLFTLFGTIVIFMAGTLLLFYIDATDLALMMSPFLLTVEPAPFHAFSASKPALFQKPDGIEIFAVVGYRNPNRTSILNCYLQRNLVQNGGLIDEVIFIPETTENGHLDWLHALTNNSDSYSISTLDDMTYSSNDLYIKIDGDVLYIEDHAIPTIVNTKMEHPESLVVSANVIHQPAVADFHLRPGVIIPSLTEMHSKQEHLLSTSSGNREGWLSSILSNRKVSHALKVQKDGSRRIESYHRLSALENAERHSWIAQQAEQHYSFLHHLEQGTLERYKFPSWKNPPKDISAALVCVKGADMRPISEAKHTASWLRKHTIIDGKGVVSHYNSEAGLQGLDLTDVLERYQNFAKQNICPKLENLV